MLVERVRLRSSRATHTAHNLNYDSSGTVQRRQGHETGKVSAGPRWQGSGPQLTLLVDVHPRT